MKVVITNLDFGQNYTELISRMSDKGYDMSWVPTTNYSSKEAVRVVKGCSAVIAGGEAYDRCALEQLRDTLQIIVRYGAGIDNIDIEAATDMGIAVTNAPGRNARAVAEYALAAMLCLTRKVNQYDRLVRDGIWSPGLSGELYGKTIGIIGFGSIGRWLAELLQGFRCQVLVYDKFLDNGLAESTGVKFAEPDDIASAADFISLHLPLTSETNRSIGLDFFSKMKRSAFLVNTSRGKILREEELITALRSKLIAGAALDVFASVPLDRANPLCAMDNVILSPHASAVTEESLAEMTDCCITDMIDFFAGKRPTNLLNPKFKKNASGWRQERCEYVKVY